MMTKKVKLTTLHQENTTKKIPKLLFIFWKQNTFHLIEIKDQLDKLKYLLTYYDTSALKMKNYAKWHCHKMI